VTSSPADLLGLWYRATAPPSPGPTATVAERERIRRGRFLSTLALLGLVVLLSLALRAAVYQDGALLVVIGEALLLAVPAMLICRLGRGPQWVVALLAAWFALRVALAWLPLPGPVQVADLSNLLLLGSPEVLAVMLLPSWTVFAVAAANALLMLEVVLLGPHSIELDRLLQFSRGEAFLQPFSVELMMALIAFLWVRTALHAAERADLAEEVARLARIERAATLAYEPSAA